MCFYSPFGLVLQFRRLVAALGHEKQDSAGKNTVSENLSVFVFMCMDVTNLCTGLICPVTDSLCKLSQ